MSIIRQQEDEEGRKEGNITHEIGFQILQRGQRFKVAKANNNLGRRLSRERIRRGRGTGRVGGIQRGRRRVLRSIQREGRPGINLIKGKPQKGKNAGRNIPDQGGKLLHICAGYQIGIIDIDGMVDLDLLLGKVSHHEAEIVDEGLDKAHVW